MQHFNSLWPRIDGLDLGGSLISMGAVTHAECAVKVYGAVPGALGLSWYSFNFYLFFKSILSDRITFRVVRVFGGSHTLPVNHNIYLGVACMKDPLVHHMSG